MKTVCATWDTARLKDLVFFQRGFDITLAQQKEGDIPVISSSGIHSFHNEAMAEGPGVIIGRKGSLGTVHYSAGPYWPHDTTLWSKQLHGNCARYVYYFLHTLGLERFDVGNSNPTLNRNHIHDIQIRIPPGAWQERIAEILTAYDDLIENNRRRIALLEQAARLLYEEWFVRLRFPGHEHVRVKEGVPDGWNIRPIGEVCDTIGGGTPSTKRPEYWDSGDIPWVTPTDVTRNGCLALLDSEKKITAAGLRSSSAKILPPYTILMTSRASVGFFATMEHPACTNQGFINIVPHTSYSRMHLLHNLMCRVEEIRANAGGATYKEISKGRFRAMTILVPDDSLLSLFEEMAFSTLEQTRLLQKQIAALKQARDLLLPRLMNGEIAV